MKTKLDLYLAVQAAAEKSLDLTKPAEIEAAFTAVVKTLNLGRDDRDSASQLFHSRRQRMIELRAQPLEVVKA